MHGVTSQAFAPEELELLDQAFKTAWAMFVAAAPSRDPGNDEGMKTLLRQKLLTMDVSSLNEVDLRQVAFRCLNSSS